MSDTTTTTTTSPAPTTASPPTTTPELNEATRKAASLLADKIINREKPDTTTSKKAEKKPDEPPKPEKKDPEDKPVESKDPDSPPPPEDKAEKKKVAKKKESSDTLTPERIADISATAAATAIKKMQLPESDRKQPEKEIESVELPPEFEADREAYSHLESINPKYKGLIKKLSDYARKEEQYIERWMQDNPGQEFDPESDSHDAFYAKNQPKIDAADIASAKDTIKEHKIEQRIREKLKSEYEPRLQAYEQEKARQAVAEKTHKATIGVFTDVLGAINGDYANAVGNNEKLEEIGKKDRIAASVAKSVTDKYAPLAAEIVALHNGVAFSDKNPVHMALEKMGTDMEKQIQSLPAGQQLDDKERSFATRLEWMRMSESERAKHWIVDEDAMLYVIAQQAKTEAEAAYKYKKEEHEWYRASLNGGSSESDKEHTPAPQKKEETKRSAPSVGSSPAVMPDKGGSTGGKKTGAGLFMTRLGLKV